MLVRLNQPQWYKTASDSVGQGFRQGTWDGMICLQCLGLPLGRLTSLESENISSKPASLAEMTQTLESEHLHRALSCGLMSHSMAASSQEGVPRDRECLENKCFKKSGEKPPDLFSPGIRSPLVTSESLRPVPT